MSEVKEAFQGFKKPSIAIDLVMLRIEKGMRQVLLVKKQDETMWHLPGSIMQLGETPQDVIKRITEDKINAENTEFEQLYTVADKVDRDDRGHIISIVYFGICKTGSMDDIRVVNGKYDAQWFNIAGKGKYKFIKSETRKSGKGESSANEENGESGANGENGANELAGLKYDHEDIIKDVLSRIKGKLRYTDIAFKFTDSRFTLSELESIYTVLNENPIPGFRRIIKNSVIGTGMMSKSSAHRPSEIFMKNVDYYS